MRKLATLAAAFSGGIFLAQYLIPLRWQLLLCPACLALGALGVRKTGAVRMRIFLIAAGLAVSLAYNWAYTQVIQAPAEALSGSTRTGVTMTLCTAPISTEYGAKATVKLQLDGMQPIRAVYYGTAELLRLSPGWTVTDDIRLQSAARIRDDDITAFTSKGIFLLAYSGGNARTDRGSADSWRWLPARAAAAVNAQIARFYSGDIAGFLTAILTGDTGSVSSEASTDLSEAGLYHILSVSGMHCAFLLSMVTFLIGKHRRRLVAGTAIPLLAFYTLLTGAQPAMVRACIMLAFLLLAPLFGRDGDVPTAMTSALLVILLQNPFAAASVGLQLSFGAVAGLYWVAPGVNRLLLGTEKPRGKAARFLSATAASSLGATVFTAPLCAYYFNIFWLVAPLSSMLCLGVATLIFTIGLPVVLLSFLFPLAGSILGLAPWAFIWYMLEMSHLLAKIPYHAVYFSNPYLKYWLFYVYALFGTAWAIKPPARRKYAVAAALASLSLLVTVRLGRWQYSRNALDVMVLDVGQGESVLMASKDHFALMDCGSKNSWYSAGDIAVEQLRSMGCKKLDYLILSHYDSDHVDGVTQLLSRMSVGQLLLPDSRDDAGLREVIVSAARRNRIPVNYVTEETVYSLGGTELTVYPPLGIDPKVDNDQGLTLLATRGGFDLLVTGDMSSGTERTLISTYALPDIEALVVGHHGSKSSTSRELLDALQPEVAAISVGSNSYGHPTLQTLYRLTGAGAAVYRTDRQGTIHLSVN